jgi:preprotein translocase subunit Sec61beta
MEELKGRDILTVGENANFIRLGGMIRFTEENRKIALQINPDAAMAADLVISSKLLRLAEIVSAK